jgi:hypothetical protein
MLLIHQVEPGAQSIISDQVGGNGRWELFYSIFNLGLKGVKIVEVWGFLLITRGPPRRGKSRDLQKTAVRILKRGVWNK